MTDESRTEAVLDRFTGGGWDYPDHRAMAAHIVRLEDKVTSLEVSLNTAGQFTLGDVAPRLAKLEQLLAALQAPDRETVVAAMKAEWLHCGDDPNATRATASRHALVAAAHHLMARFGL